MIGDIASNYKVCADRIPPLIPNYPVGKLPSAIPEKILR
jgi:hypothetical protein